MKILQEFKASISFISIVISFLIVGSIVVFSSDKATIHVFFNSFHHPFFDTFFKYYTHAADGITVVLVGVALLFKRIRYGLITLLSLGVASGVTQFLKRQVFTQHYRPSRFFEDFPEVDLHYVEGVVLHCCHSFPSGHTTAGFALFASLTLAFPYKKMPQIFGVLAILVGYSRVYISQHHFEDILVGSIVGTVFTFVIAYLFSKSKAAWLEQPLTMVFKKKKAV